VVAEEVLEDHGHRAPQLLRIHRVDVHPVPVNAARIGCVEAGQQLGQRGLAGAVLADGRHDLALGDLQRDVAQRGLRAAWVGEADALHLQPLEPVRRRRRRARGDRLRQQLQEGDVVIQVEGGLRKRARGVASLREAGAGQRDPGDRDPRLRQRDPPAERQPGDQQEGRAQHRAGGEVGRR
jgi:hypothetical protein